MKILCATFKHETNTFSPIVTDLARFEEWGLHFGADAARAMAGTRMPQAAYMKLAEERGAEIVTPVAAEAMPAGPVTEAAYERLSQAILEAAQSTASIYLIIIGASVFSYFVTLSGVSEAFVEALKATDLAPIAIVLLLLVGYLILGSIFETVSAMLITLPFVLPLIIELGYDPIWWGIINVAIIELGMITPPIGMNVMLLHSMNPAIALRQIYSGVGPFILCNILVLLTLVIVPDISLVLLRWFG
jgi:TRAP-type C4-dicarboxylate transport system permease large subunit